MMRRPDWWPTDSGPPSDVPVLPSFAPTTCDSFVASHLPIADADMLTTARNSRAIAT